MVSKCCRMRDVSDGNSESVRAYMSELIPNAYPQSQGCQPGLAHRPLQPEKGLPHGGLFFYLLVP